MTSYKNVLKALPLLGALFLSACATSPANRYVEPAREALSIDNVRYCSGYSCHTIHSIGLEPYEWSAIEALFEGDVNSPAEERRRVSLAVGLYETFAGAKTGTTNDAPESPILFKTTGQLDCIDEATNTSMFLHLLDKEGLIKFHTVEKPAQRGFIIGRWFHSTAVLVEKGGGDGYAIDSWFYKTGTPAEVVPLQTWLDGWKPDKTKVSD